VVHFKGFSRFGRMFYYGKVSYLNGKGATSLVELTTSNTSTQVDWKIHLRLFGQLGRKVIQEVGKRAPWKIGNVL
jgi:hypothetical protein